MKKFLLIALVLSLTNPAAAEDINKIFEKVNEYVGQENYSKAIKELAWAEKELQKLHNKKLESLLPDSLVGYSGGTPESSSAMGFNNLERKYNKEGQSFTVSITGGSAGGAMGGLAALGQMGAMMGNQPGVDSFRLDGRTANLQVRNNRAELTVFLESGSILKFEERKSADEGATLKKAAEELKISDIDSYLKGQ